MAHKMTLTGKSISSLRSIGNIFPFDMEESGSPSAPKGLPKSSPITYTVFVNQKQLTKAGIDEQNLQENRLFIQGEPTLDIPVDECWGEIGVVCYQIEIVADRKKKSAEKEPSSQKEIEEAEEQVAAATEEKTQRQPKGTQDLIPLDAITIPEEFLQTVPNRQKTHQAIEFVKKHGHLDKPITINAKNGVLTDGYRRYVVAQTLKLDVVPVTYS
ncbi:plasmid stabilization protein [Ammoniphilus oxalaticus]|uniref:Plasmid stabilization protein n=1 Tax=Ammoniphilus oxalaticus TaxID=66863 RepID=A0A419SQ19_9BACL|nr:plasmid stabilization protein [Ammoniphilus oxalaticus]RKD26490.1 plasmid stabilization protein [Ammoniphilus oxalaticus]